jgi:hypothetical protein
MARLREKPIEAVDMETYLAGYSDFTFELKTLKLVTELGLTCEHGGLYEDPVTKKSRQFDIRAEARAENIAVRLAIECKNVRDNFPLLVSCVPRIEAESYHDVALIQRRSVATLSTTALTPRGEVIRLEGERSIYQVGAPVGKTLAQVGLTDEKTPAIFASDADVFDKWSQALASAEELVSRSYWQKFEQRGCLCGILAIVVVPDSRLWRVLYDDNGGVKEQPHLVDRCSLFVGRTYSMEKISGPSYDISHMEIVTLTGLRNILTNIVDTNLRASNFFPRNSLSRYLARPD